MVSECPVTVRAQIHSQVCPCCICDGHSGTGTYCKGPSFFPVIILSVFHSHIKFIYHWCYKILVTDSIIKWNLSLPRSSKCLCIFWIMCTYFVFTRRLRTALNCFLQALLPDSVWYFVTTFSLSFKIGLFNSLSLHIPVCRDICVCVCVCVYIYRMQALSRPTNPYVAALMQTDQWCHLLCSTRFCVKRKCLQQENEAEKI